MAWAPPYARVRELSALIAVGDSLDDADLERAIEAASRVVDHACNRQFGQVRAAESRTYEGCWSRRRGGYVVECDDVQDLTGFTITVAGSALSAAQYSLRPRNMAQRGRPYTRLLVSAVTTDTFGLGTGPGTVDVLARWGWSAIPETVKQATLLQASRFFARKDAPFGVAGSPELGNELRLLDKADPDVMVMLRDFRRDHPMLVAR